jgi:hypothetical protein
VQLQPLLLRGLIGEVRIALRAASMESANRLADEGVAQVVETHVVQPG